MRRRIRPATEDLEPRVVLSVGSLTPRTAEPPVEEPRSETPAEEPAAQSPDAGASGRTNLEPVAVTPAITTTTPDDSPTSQPVDAPTDNVADRNEPTVVAIDAEPADVITVNPDALKKIARLKQQQNNVVDVRPTTGVVTQVPATDTETVNTQSDTEPDVRDDIVVRPVEPTAIDDADSRDDEVDTDLGDLTDVRDVTDGEEIDSASTAVKLKSHHSSDAAETAVAEATVPNRTDSLVAAARERVALEESGLATKASAERDTGEASEVDTLGTPSAVSWIDSLHNSALSWFGTNTEAGPENERLAEHTASAAGVAGVLSLMAFGRRGMGDSERLFSGALRGLLDLRDWRPSRSTNRRRQKSVPNEPTRKEPVAVAPENLDEPELSDAFVMSVAVPVNPNAFAMSAIPADTDASGSDASESNVAATTAVVGATVAAGGFAARQRSGGRRSKPAPRQQIDFGGTTFARPQHHIG